MNSEINNFDINGKKTNLEILNILPIRPIPTLQEICEFHSENLKL